MQRELFGGGQVPAPRKLTERELGEMDPGQYQRRVVGLVARAAGLAPIPARAGASDPWTSHAAARDVERTGLAQQHRDLVLARVRATPGSTSAELAGDGLDRWQVARRLPEIQEVRQGDARTCRVTGRACVTWWPK